MATLEQLAARLRKLGPALVDATLPELANAVREELRNSIAAAESSEGEDWAARKRGGRALAGAMKSIHVGVVDKVIVVRLTGVEARHHFGRGRGGVERPIIPTGPLPKAWGRALKRVVDQRFAEVANHG